MATESETIGMEGAMIVAEESVTTSTHHANFMRAEVIHTKIVSSALVAITSRRTGQSSSTNLARLLSGTRRLTKAESLTTTAVESSNSSTSFNRNPELPSWQLHLLQPLNSYSSNLLRWPRDWATSPRPTCSNVCDRHNFYCPSSEATG
eukprot:scaffold27115_cov73-Skeletonema_marinoi.AAC.1